MIYAIGDIHGEYKKLLALLNRLNKSATGYIFLGDYLDKGTDPKKTVELLNKLSKRKKCVFLMGDHEYAWLKCLKANAGRSSVRKKFADFLLRYGGINTLQSYLGRALSASQAKKILFENKELQSILKNLLPFLKSLKLFYESDDFIFVHAGINPDKKNLPLWRHNKEELLFIRHRFIKSNVFYNGKKIIFGHTATKRPYIDTYKIGIDTGAVYPELGALTAFNIETGSFIGYNKKGIYEKDINNLRPS